MEILKNIKWKKKIGKVKWKMENGNEFDKWKIENENELRKTNMKMNYENY